MSAAIESVIERAANIVARHFGPDDSPMDVALALADAGLLATPRTITPEERDDAREKVAVALAGTLAYLASPDESWPYYDNDDEMEHDDE